jgi:hypothetical protein
MRAFATGTIRTLYYGVTPRPIILLRYLRPSILINSRSLERITQAGV